MSPNRLASETSPYLLQHADNPVDWFPWGDEALEAARERDVPILLSVGYSACHWCHVMAHESFEDDTTAALMNERFVNIKVDREERPDIDGIYMDAVQAMTGRGGWPMTVFLTPEQQPFYAGTYFPPQPHHGLPSFAQVLNGVARAWNEQRADLTAQAQQVIDHLRSRTFATTQLPGADALDRAVDALASSFDPRWGGFGPAPKFPQPMTIDLLLRMHMRGDVRALPMVQTTLDKMAEGGMFDHVGGGFHRYSVDGRWHVPHFEKMLYDNALLTTAYTRGWLVTRTSAYRTAAMRTMTFMLRELRLPDGGFASSLDADTEGHEGRFYTWSWDDLVEIAGEPVAAYLGALPGGNWEGTNVLWTPVDIATTAKGFALTPEQLSADVTAATERLLTERAKRERPGLDDKVLAAWNGLAIGALAEGGRVFGDTEAIDAAVRAATFVRDHLCVDGRLMRSWRDGATGGPAFLEDHASLATGLIRLYEATGDPTWFAEARSLCDAILELFIDPEEPGLFQVGSDASQPVFRPKDLIDSATPSGNSAAALVLQTMSALTGVARYADVAENALVAVADPIAHHPSGFAEALCALERATSDAVELAIVGPSSDPGRVALEDCAWDRYLPNVVLATGDGSDAGGVPLLEERTMAKDRATAYLCRGFVCDLPRTDPADLASHLDALSKTGPPG